MFLVLVGSQELFRPRVSAHQAMLKGVCKAMVLAVSTVRNCGPRTLSQGFCEPLLKRQSCSRSARGDGHRHTQDRGAGDQLTQLDGSGRNLGDTGN